MVVEHVVSVRVETLEVEGGEELANVFGDEGCSSDGGVSRSTEGDEERLNE